MCEDQGFLQLFPCEPRLPYGGCANTDCWLPSQGSPLALGLGLKIFFLQKITICWFVLCVWHRTAGWGLLSFHRVGLGLASSAVTRVHWAPSPGQIRDCPERAPDALLLRFLRKFLGTDQLNSEVHGGRAQAGTKLVFLLGSWQPEGLQVGLCGQPRASAPFSVLDFFCFVIGHPYS